MNSPIQGSEYSYSSTSLSKLLKLESPQLPPLEIEDFIIPKPVSVLRKYFDITVHPNEIQAPPVKIICETKIISERKIISEESDVTFVFRLEPPQPPQIEIEAEERKGLGKIRFGLVGRLNPTLSSH